MTESSNPTQIPPQQEQNPQQEQQLESLIPFEPTPQVGFDIEDIIFNPNNFVALFYPPYTNSKYFKVLSDFISKCCLREAFTMSPNQYKEYLSKFWYTVKTQKNSKVWFSTPTRGILREVGLTTFRNAIGGKLLVPLYKLNKKFRKKVVPYPMFLSMLLQHKMEGYRNDKVTLNLTQDFSAHNWALKKNQPEGSPFTKHILGICIADVLVAFKAPKPSSKAEKEVTQGIKPRAKSRRRKSQIPFTYNHPQSKIETTKGVTNEEGAHRQLSSGMLAFIHNKPIYSVSTIIHFESASRHDASADLTAEVDLGKSAPNDSVYKQQDMDKGTQNYSLDHMFIGTNPSVLVDKTKSARDELKIAHTESGANLETSKAKKEVSFRSMSSKLPCLLSSSDDIKKEIKLEDLSKLVQYRSSHK
ncbi:hypothetical protein Tco_0362669 [Tanacetum coccineum]